jgi:hypothetical protein
MMNEFNPIKSPSIRIEICCESSDFCVEVLLTKSSTIDIDDGDDNNKDERVVAKEQIQRKQKFYLLLVR